MAILVTKLGAQTLPVVQMNSHVTMADAFQGILYILYFETSLFTKQLFFRSWKCDSENDCGILFALFI